MLNPIGHSFKLFYYMAIMNVLLEHIELFKFAKCTIG